MYISNVSVLIGFCEHLLPYVCCHSFTKCCIVLVLWLCSLPRPASAHVPREAAQSLCRHRSIPSVFGRFPADTAVNSSQHPECSISKHLKIKRQRVSNSLDCLCQSALCYSTLVCSGHFQVLLAVTTEQACLRHGLTI